MASVAEKFRFIEKRKHLWMPMIKRVKHKHKDIWIQAFIMGGDLCLSSHRKADFDLVRDYLVKMGIIHKRPIES